MALLDHFHPPISDFCSCESFNADWITMISQWLNAHLPSRYVARSRVHIGSLIEVDVGRLESLAETNRGDSVNGVMTMPATWAPPRATLKAEAEFAEVDEFEVEVFEDSGGHRLVAAIELVSPRNKDRIAARKAFARKCVGYLARGVSVVVVDVVTNRSANMHRELMEQSNLSDVMTWNSTTSLQCVAYRMVAENEKSMVEAWPHALNVGEPLPTVPLWLASDYAIPCELETTYEAARRGLRIP